LEALFEMDSIATLGYIFAAKLAWSLLLFLKDLAGGLGLLGAVDVKKLGSWAVGAHLCRRPPPAARQPASQPALPTAYYCCQLTRAACLRGRPVQLPVPPMVSARASRCSSPSAA
jgi:hypothetical protein